MTVAEKIFDADVAANALDEAWHFACTGLSIQALSIAGSILASAEQRGDQCLIARSSQQSAWYCFQLGKTEQGLDFAEKAVVLWRQLEEPAFEAEALSIKAWLQLELGNLESAIEFAAEALNIADHSGNLRSRSLAINVVGVIFWMTRQPTQALDYCGRAVELAREACDVTFECWWLINLGGAHSEVAYLALERDDRTSFESSMRTAIDTTRQAYDIAATLKDAWAERLCLGNLAEYFNALDEFVMAEAYLAQYRAVPGNDDDRGKGHYLDILGRTLISLTRYEEALVPLNEAYALAKESSNVETLMNACLYLSRAHEHLRAFEPALHFYKRYHSLHQQFTAERTQQNARLVEIRYETKKLKTSLDTEAESSAQLARSLAALQQQTTLLTEAANTDPLTGLANRRRLEAILSDIDLSRSPYALAMLDVDHFKTINDTFSHITGDRVLAQIGSLIKNSVQEGDLAVRFGGEEFIVMMPGATMARAKKACEQMRLTIARYDWSRISAELTVTISIGVAISNDAPNAEVVLERADHHLYCAKQSGRNRVVCHPNSSLSKCPERPLSKN
ncbi:diguanylate cyclase (GGDEF)-like protein [Rhizobium skierniewicense]|uniref:diguanylate cyclase n=1 Tax=Rhizobium skierniewicense TaxID=984260 RepID=A0A7W6G2A0_9HYPH|nr:tetratricopeptide repeat-containing diguanylate cyclase [Rhizobium skierniewicense]MBB3945321.1 diguanylate cyclase (GGDEF)-like protein [Rhizobium skierniewicense]NTF33053.1 diguanylate cyclase [Rhizobium skierniewicense]